ncbi:MAG: hypothetical protein JNM77_10575 [Pseudonocardia sp.]|nr:hypothetical protein [Pseudonocardia sp.]
MNHTPDGPAAAPPDLPPEASDTADASPVPAPRTGPEPLPRRVRGASGVATSGSTAEVPVDVETLNRLITRLHDI